MRVGLTVEFLNYFIFVFHLGQCFEVCRRVVGIRDELLLLLNAGSDVKLTPLLLTVDEHTW